VNTVSKWAAVLAVLAPPVYAHAPSTVTLTASLNPSTFGQAVTFAATVSSASGTPTGTVTFEEGSGHLGKVTLSGGVATLTTSTLGVGTKSITAVYGGDADFSGSTSSALGQMVTAATSTVALSSSPNPSTFGQAVTFTATAASELSGAPSGSVTFENGSVSLGRVKLTGGVATLTKSTLGVGTDSITAVYGGDADFSGSTSSALGQVVTAATSTITLTSSLNPSTSGQAVTFTATVAPAFSGVANGNVTFKNGNATLGKFKLAGGVATLTTSTLGVGADSITAVYGGNADFSGSASSALGQVVTAATTTVSLTSSPSPSTFGQAVTLTATVSSTSGTPAGLVVFNNGNAWIGAAGLTGGVATLTTSTLGVGTNSITAVYGGSANYSGSASSALGQVVTAATSAVTLTSSLNPSTLGQSVSFTASVAPQFSGTPSGEVAFKNGSSLLGSVNLTGGVASLTTSSLSSGTLTITASYLPSAGFSASSGTLTQTVNLTGPPNYTLSGTPLYPASLTSGGTSTSTIMVTPADGYTGSVRLSCTIIGNTHTPAPSCSFSTSSVNIEGTHSGTSALTVSTSSATLAGTYTISVTGSDTNSLPPSNGSQALTLTTMSLIQHIVVIFQENRTPDNLFQDPVLISRGADIASSGMNSLGQTIPLTPIDLGTVGPSPQYYDLSHTHDAFVAMYDGGKMDGADLIECNPAPRANCPPNAQFVYVDPSDVQPYFAMAEQYTFGDRMFQTNEGPSFPAHQFILAGTSAPTATSSLFADGNATGNISGCIAPLTTVVQMIDANGRYTAPEYPCFEHRTLTDLLETNGLTWHYYTPKPGFIWTAPDAIEHICMPQIINGALACTGSDWNDHVIMPQTQVLQDIPNGQLAQVTWVIPEGLQSDHPQGTDGSGPSWVASIVNAIGNSPYWANTAIFITWDDWGGFYDHVLPTVIDDGVSWGSGYVYGFRVPFIVVSPYAKPAYISHTSHDFGSILKFIETNFNLPTLGYADFSADDLSDCFNLTQAPLTFSVIPAPVDAAQFINDKRAPTDPDDD